MPTTLPSPFDVLPMVAFEVDRGLVASAVTGGSALMERSGIGNGSDIALLHPTLVEPLREAIGGRSVRRRVVIAGTPMLLDAQPHDAGALGLLLALDESRADATDLTASVSRRARSAGACGSQRPRSRITCAASTGDWAAPRALRLSVARSGSALSTPPFWMRSTSRPEPR